MILNTQYEKTIPFCSFFDLPRAAIIRDTPSVRLRKAAKGMCTAYMFYIYVFTCLLFKRGQYSCCETIITKSIKYTKP